MTIIHVISSLDLDNGGPSKSVSDLAINQSLLCKDVVILTSDSPNPYLKESTYHRLKLVFIKNLLFKRSWSSILNKQDVTIFHGHGIWQMLVHNMAINARNKEIPYVISPRGMLEPWAMNSRKLKKKFAFFFYQKNDLLKAACIHATSQMEADNFRKLGFVNPIAIIPNGIDVVEFPVLKNKAKKNKYTLLFLSRIHPKKGIEFLIQAWDQIDKTLKKGWNVEIAGNGEENYIASLQKLIILKGLEDEISIIGPKFGLEKISLYQRADLFVLPTYSENFGIVVAEALACEVPVITTKGTPWEELNSKHCGWWIDIGVEPLVEALQVALCLSDKERLLMGENGRKLVEEKYSIEAVAEQMLELYYWILEKGDRPDFIYHS